MPEPTPPWMTAGRQSCRVILSDQLSSALLAGVDAVHDAGHEWFGHDVDEVGVVGGRGVELVWEGVDEIGPSGGHVVGDAQLQQGDGESVSGA